MGLNFSSTQNTVPKSARVGKSSCNLFYTSAKDKERESERERERERVDDWSG